MPEFFGIWSIISIVILIVFIISAVIIFRTFQKTAGNLTGNMASVWRSDINSPRMTVSAEVVSKRTDVQRRRTGKFGEFVGPERYTVREIPFYYVSFRTDSGDLTELRVTSAEYSLLVVGDRGKLSYQGSCLLSFERLS